MKCQNDLVQGYIMVGLSPKPTSKFRTPIAKERDLLPGRRWVDPPYFGESKLFQQELTFRIFYQLSTWLAHSKAQKNSNWLFGVLFFNVSTKGRVDIWRKPLRVGMRKYCSHEVRGYKKEVIIRKKYLEIKIMTVELKIISYS